MLESVELGLVFGAGIELRRWHFEGRYSAGLTSIADDPSLTAEVRNRGFTILAGVRF
jgi:hypothetical protein